MMWWGIEIQNIEYPQSANSATASWRLIMWLSNENSFWHTRKCNLYALTAQIALQLLVGCQATEQYLYCSRNAIILAIIYDTFWHFAPKHSICGLSLESFHREDSNEYPKDIFSCTVFTLSIRTPELLTIYVLKFEPVQFTTRCCV